MKQRVRHDIFLRLTGEFDREVITYPNGSTVTLFQPSRSSYRQIAQLENRLLQERAAYDRAATLLSHQLRLIRGFFQYEQRRAA